jgi:hypothetical protein
MTENNSPPFPFPGDERISRIKLEEKLLSTFPSYFATQEARKKLNERLSACDNETKRVPGREDLIKTSPEPKAGFLGLEQARDIWKATSKEAFKEELKTLKPEKTDDLLRRLLAAAMASRTCAPLSDVELAWIIGTTDHPKDKDTWGSLQVIDNCDGTWSLVQPDSVCPSI